MEATEETSLLTDPPSTDPEALRHELLYQRFSPSQKRVIVALISLAGLIPCTSRVLNRDTLAGII